MVVFPAWVPPLINMFKPCSTAYVNFSATSLVKEFNSTKSCNELPCIKCFLIFTAQCVAVTSGIAACNLLPSGNRASTKGLVTSNRRPPHINNLSKRSRISLSCKTKLVNWLFPLVAIKIRLGELIQTSSISGSSMNG